MKTTLKTTLAISSLLMLPGCMDYGWFNKKEVAQENIEATTPIHHENQNASPSKCSHKGCTHDHSKDVHKKHNDEQDIDDIDIEMITDIDYIDEDDSDDEEIDDIDDNNY